MHNVKRLRTALTCELSRNARTFITRCLANTCHSAWAARPIGGFWLDR